MRVLVCGGRTWGYARHDATDIRKRAALYERGQVFEVLDRIDMVLGIDVVIHGDARGADRCAQSWADARGRPVAVFPADWDRYGRRAGPLRNSLMLVEGRPELCVAFPGGAGTADMVGKAVDAVGVEMFDLGGLV